jgi:hypothetical protein
MADNREVVEHLHGKRHAIDVVKNRPGLLRDTSFDILKDGKHETGGYSDLGRAVEKARDIAKKS